MMPIIKSTALAKDHKRPPKGATKGPRHKHDEVPGTIRFVIGMFMVFMSPGFMALWATALVATIGFAVAIWGQAAIRAHYGYED